MMKTKGRSPSERPSVCYHHALRPSGAPNTSANRHGLTENLPTASCLQPIGRSKRSLVVEADHYLIFPGHTFLHRRAPALCDCLWVITSSHRRHHKHPRCEKTYS